MDLTATSSTVERAFQLARDGTCATMDDIRRRLKIERYDCVEAHLSSGSLSRQLNALLRAAEGSNVAPGPGVGGDPLS